jgi:hypothetical protein
LPSGIFIYDVAGSVSQAEPTVILITDNVRTVNLLAVIASIARIAPVSALHVLVVFVILFTFRIYIEVSSSRCVVKFNIVFSFGIFIPFGIWASGRFCIGIVYWQTFGADT